MLRRTVGLLACASLAQGLQQLKTRRRPEVVQVQGPAERGPALSAAPAAARVEEWRAAAMAFGVACAAVAEPALAKGGEYGLAEGRTISFLHPIAMGVSFLATLAAGFTGYQWRRLREVGTEVAAAKKVVSERQAALDALGEEADTTAAAASLSAATAELDALSATRKDLAAGDFRDKHYVIATILLAIGIPFAIEGPVNTYMRAGKLFPGPHLYAGAAVVALWALAAAFVPHMQKGKEWARNGHIGVNAVTFLLFAYYQIPTGLEIAQKVIEKTKFP